VTGCSLHDFRDARMTSKSVREPLPLRAFNFTTCNAGGLPYLVTPPNTQQRCIRFTKPPWSTASALLRHLSAIMANNNSINNRNTKTTGTLTLLSSLKDVDFSKWLVKPHQCTKMVFSSTATDQQPVSSSYHNTSINALSLVDTVNELLFQWDGNSEGRKTKIMKKTMWKFLLVGTEGSGKTTLLDDIAFKARSKGIQVLRPALPLDVLGTTIGRSYGG
jgi:hypothetical protein